MKYRSQICLFKRNILSVYLRCRYLEINNTRRKLISKSPLGEANCLLSHLLIKYILYGMETGHFNIFPMENRITDLTN